MVSELDTSSVPVRRKERVSARTLGPIEEWIVRFHIGWKEEWSIKSVKHLPSRYVLKLWGWRWYVTVQNEQYLLAVGLSCYKSYRHQQLYKIKLINTNYEFIYFDIELQEESIPSSVWNERLDWLSFYV